MEENDTIKGAQIQADATRAAGDKSFVGTIIGAIIGALIGGIISIFCLSVTVNHDSLTVQNETLRKEKESLLDQYNELESRYNKLADDYKLLTAEHEQYRKEYDVTKNETYDDIESGCMFVVNDLFPSIKEASITIYYGEVNSYENKNHIIVSMAEPIPFDKNGDYSLTLLSIEDDDHCCIVIKKSEPIIATP